MKVAEIQYAGNIVISSQPIQLSFFPKVSGGEAFWSAGYCDGTFKSITAKEAVEWLVKTDHIKRVFNAGRGQ